MDISVLLGNPRVRVALIIIAIIVVLYILYQIGLYLLDIEKREPYLIKKEWDGYTQSDKISGKRLYKSESGIAQSWQFWIFIEDYNYNHAQPKHIFHVGREDGTIASPSVWLHPRTNNLTVRFDSYSKLDEVNKTVSGIECQKWTESTPHDTSQYTETLFPDAGLGDHNYCRNPGNLHDRPWCFTMDPNKETEVCGTQNMNPIGKLDMKIKPCDITNIPLQRWNHVAIVLVNKTVDVYLNGKLERSCTLENIPRIHFGNIYITNWNGFGGKLYNLQYANRAMTQTEIYNLYRAGHKGMDWWTSLIERLPKIDIKVEVKFNDETEAEENVDFV